MKKAYLEKPIQVPRFEETRGFYTTSERSRLMSRIHGRNTKPEIEFRKALHAAGVRYRVDFKGLPGKPDISKLNKRFAIFIDGEFWHGYDWVRKRTQIKSNRKFWLPKIERNIQRDREVNNKLKAMGFQVFRFWGHEVKNELGSCLKQVLDYVKSIDQQY